MGTPAGCSYANLFYAIHERKIYKKYPNLRYVKRYIDDIFGIWIPAEDPTEKATLWQQFI